MSFSDRVLGFGAFPNRDTDDYEIEQSLMFEDADSSALHRTPGSAGNRRTWTWSGWVKKCASLGSSNTSDIYPMFSTDGSNHNMNLVFYQDDLFVQDYIYPTGTQYYLITNAKYRDYSAWYHIVLAVDTTQGTASNRVKLYVNGEQVTSFSTETYPSEDYEGWVNSASMQHNIGNAYTHSANYGLDGYMAEVHLIDGTALTPASFGKTDSTTGQWIPKEAKGLTYGTCGYYLKFVSGAIGTDSSGVGNNFTVSNLADADVMLDTPTNNFATLNPLAPSGATLTQGNLHKNSNTPTSPATFYFSSGKWYCEVAQLSGSSTGSTFNYMITVEDSVVGGTRSGWTRNYVALGMANGGNTPDGFSVTTDTNGTVTQPTGSRPNAVAIIGVAIDVDDGDVEFYINGTLNGKCLGITNWTLPITIGLAHWTGTMGSQPYSINFGQNGTFNGNVTAGGNADGNGYGNFKYSPPTDYLAMCSKNLSAPTIALPENYFNPVIYTGNATGRDITVGFQPDFVWTKNRNSSWSNLVQDSVRGATKELRTNDTIVENTEAQSITAFSSTGYSLGTYNDYNANTYTFVSWNWKAGGAPTADNSASAGATPTAGSVKIDGSNLGSALAGSIAATRLSANTTSGFSVVKYEGTGSNATVAHGLGVAPDLIMVKNLEATDNWQVYVGTGVTDPQTDYLALNGTAGFSDDNTVWNDTAPTSTVFSIGTADHVNENTKDLVAYCFASIDGYSKVGSYEGNNNANGMFVHTGFLPAYVLIKYIDGAGESWWMLDNKRDTYNPTGEVGWANLSAQFYDYGEMLDFVSNGFKIRSTNVGVNGNTSTYIYMAFAESPFKYSNAR